MRLALRRAAALLWPGRGTEDLQAHPWTALRTADLERLREALTARGLSAVRGVLRECVRLGLMAAEDFAPPTRRERRLQGEQLIMEGVPGREVAEALGVSRQLVHQWREEMGLAAPPLAPRRVP